MKTHACSELQQENRHLALAFEGTSYQRWVMLENETLRCLRQVVRFCPHCGLDLSRDCLWQSGWKVKRTASGVFPGTHRRDTLPPPSIEETG